MEVVSTGSSVYIDRLWLSDDNLAYALKLLDEIIFLLDDGFQLQHMLSSLPV